MSALPKGNKKTLNELNVLINAQREEIDSIVDSFNEVLVDTGLFQKFEKTHGSYQKYLKGDGWLSVMFHYFSSDEEDWENWKVWIHNVATYVKQRVIELTVEDIHYIATKNGHSWSGCFDGSSMAQVLDPYMPKHVRIARVGDTVVMVAKDFLDDAIGHKIDEREVANAQRNRILDNFEEDYIEHYIESVEPVLKAIHVYQTVRDNLYINAIDYIVDYTLSKYIPTGFYGEMAKGMIFFFNCEEEDIECCAMSMLDVGDFISWRSFDGKQLPETPKTLSINFDVSPDDGFIKDYTSLRVADTINGDEIVEIVRGDKHDSLIYKEDRGYGVIVVQSGLIICSDSFFHSIDEAKSSLI